MYDPGDGGVMHMEDEPAAAVEVEYTHLEYGSIGFGEDRNNWEWNIEESPEYHPEPFNDWDDNDEDAPT